MHLLRSRLGVVLAALVLTSAPQAAAEVAIVCHHDCPALANHRRVLGGHRFVPSALVKWGFVETLVTSTSSVGVIRVDEPITKQALMFGDRRLDHLMLGEKFEVDVAVAPWLGLLARGTGSSVMPLDTATAGRGGAHIVAGIDVGGIVRLIRVGGFQLAAKAEIGWSTDQGVSVARLPSSPRVDHDVWRLRPSAIAAFALTRRIGLQSSLTYELTDISDHDDSANALGLGAALTIALAPAPWTALLGARYTWEDDWSDPSDVAASLTRGGDTLRTEVGVLYQGVPALDVGAAVQWQHDDEDHRVTLDLRLAYYF